MGLADELGRNTGSNSPTTGQNTQSFKTGSLSAQLGREKSAITSPNKANPAIAPGTNFFNDFLTRREENAAAKPTAEDTAIENAKAMSSEKKMAVEGEERAKLESQKADYQRQLDKLNNTPLNPLFDKNEAQIERDMQTTELQAKIDSIDEQLNKEYSRGEATLNAWATGTKGAYQTALSTLYDFAKRNEGRIVRDVEYTGIGNEAPEGEDWGVLDTDNKALEKSFDWLSGYKDIGVANVQKAAQQKAEAKEGASAAEKFMLDALSTALDIGADTALSLATFGGAGAASMAARVFGNTAAESAAQGDDLDTQVAKGTVAALIEAASEKIGDGFELAYGASFGKLFGKQAQEAATKVVNANSKAIKAFLKTSAGESFEEVVSDIANIVADRLFGWNDGEGNVLTDIIDQKNDILYDALLGGFMGAIGGVGTAQNAYNAATMQNAIAKGVDAAIQANVESNADVETMPEGTKNAEVQKNTAQAGTERHPMSMEDYADSNSPVWNNLAYDDTASQQKAMKEAHDRMVTEGKVVEVPESTMQKTAESFPDLRGMKKAERTPILKQKMAEIKTSLRQFLSGIKGGNFEFEVNGNVLEAKLYDTGIKEVLEKITQDKANMLSQSDQIFKNAEYLYSLPDYDGDPNIYRWNYFYTPVKIGDSTVGVRIAVRDMATPNESQIYNWGIKKAPTLDGGSPEQSSLSPDVSSVGGIDASLDGARRLPNGSIPGDVSSDASSGNTGTVLNMEKNSPQVTPEAPQRANASDTSIPTPRQNVNSGQAENSGSAGQVRKSPADMLMEAAQPISANNAHVTSAVSGDVNSQPVQQNAPQTATELLKSYVGANASQNINVQQNPTANDVNYAPDNGAQRERGFSANVRSDNYMNDAVRAELESDPLYYNQKKNADALKAAETIFQKGADYSETVLRDAIAKAKAGAKLRPEMVVLSKLVANDMAKNGRVESARSLLSDVAIELTEAGQLGQSARILREADPFTREAYIRKTVEMLNKTLTKGQRNTNIKNGLGDESGYIVVDEALLNSYLTAKTEAEQAQIVDTITQQIADQIPATLGEKFTAIRYLNMLGNFKTQGRNIVGNTAMSAITTAKRHIVQSALEMAGALATGGKIERNTSLFYEPNLFKEANADFNNIADEAMGEAKYTPNSKVTNQAIQDKRTTFNSKFFKAYDKATKTAMEVGDRVFIKYQYADAMAGWMQAHGIKSINDMSPEQLDAARNFAINEAQEATFRDKNAVSDFVKYFDKGWENHGNFGKAAKTVTQGILPFRGTPANVAVRAIEYSPVGAINTLLQAKFGNADATKTLNNLSKNISGTALAIAGYLLAAAGEARGSEDDKKLESFQKLQGQSDYSIQYNGKWISLSQLAPASVPFFMGVKMYEFLSGVENFSTDAMKAILGCITDPMLDMSMLSGLNDALDNLSNFNGDADALPKFMINSMLSYLTQGLSNTLVSQITTTLRDENRQTNYAQSGGVIGKDTQYALAKILNKVPLTDYNRQDYVDAWGRKQSNGTLAERAFTNLINPTYYSKINSTDVDKELERLYTDNKDVADFPTVFPSKASRETVYGKGKEGNNLKMTPEEYEQYSIDRGQRSLQYVSEFMASPEYAAMSDMERAKTISELYSFAANRALHEVKTNNGVEDTTDEELLITGVDKPGTSDDRTAVAEKNVPKYIAYKNSLSEARKNNDFDTQDRLIEQYKALPDDIQAALMERNQVTKQDLTAHDLGLSAKAVYEFNLAKDNAQGLLDANSTKSGVVSLFALADAKLSDTEKRIIIDNYDKLKSGYLSKPTATTARILTDYGFTLADAADFFYDADYSNGEASGTLTGSKVAVALSKLPGLSDKEREAIYQEFRAALDPESSRYPWKTSYAKAYSGAQYSMTRYGNTYGRTDNSSRIGNITSRNTPGADLLISGAQSAQNTSTTPTSSVPMFGTQSNPLLDWLNTTMR